METVVEVAGGDEGYGLENIGKLIARKNVSTLQLVANIEAANGHLVPVNILPDTGASHNILDKKAAEQAGLTGFQCKYWVTAHGGHVTEHEAMCGELTLINPKQLGEHHKISFYAYKNPCGPFFPTDWSKLKGGWPHLKHLDLPALVSGQPVELILGCENLRLFEALKPSSLKGPTDPIARLTPLGWMVGGRTYPEASTEVEGDPRIIQGEVGIVEASAVKVRQGFEYLNVANNNDFLIAGNPRIEGRELTAKDAEEDLRKTCIAFGNWSRRKKYGS